MAERTQQLGQDIVPCAVEYKHRPAVRSKHGRWKSASIIIWVEMAERISYLTGKLGQSTAMAASSINAWGGIAALLPIIGAIIADSFIGKYYTIIVASFIYILIEKYTYQHSGMVHVPSTVLRKKVFQALYKGSPERR